MKLSLLAGLLRKFLPLLKLLLNDPTSIASCLVGAVTPRRFAAEASVLKLIESNRNAEVELLLQPQFTPITGVLQEL